MVNAYTYLIGWSKYDRWYYGVRYANGCSPKDLWVKYKTSSKIVHEFAKVHGDPDTIQVRRTFNNRQKALQWEHKVLRRLQVCTSRRWLNQSDGSMLGHNSSGTHRWSVEARTRMSLQRKGVPKPSGHGLKVAIAQQGKSVSRSSREKMSQAKRGKFPEAGTRLNKDRYYCTQCGIHTNKGNFVRWHSHLER